MIPDLPPWPPAPPPWGDTLVLLVVLLGVWVGGTLGVVGWQWWCS